MKTLGRFFPLGPFFVARQVFFDIWDHLEIPDFLSFTFKSVDRHHETTGFVPRILGFLGSNHGFWGSWVPRLYVIPYLPRSNRGIDLPGS